MVGYRRKCDRGKYGQAALNEAIQKVKAGEISKRKAAATQHVESTVAKHTHNASEEDQSKELHCMSCHLVINKRSPL